jgi:uncharacterized membrane protein
MNDMSKKPHNKNNLQTNQNHNNQEHSIRAASYRGPIPPPNMLEGYREIDPSFPERIIKMAERALDMADKELEIIADTQNKDLNIRQQEAETKRKAVDDDAKYNFRAQMIILIMVISVLGTATLLGMNGFSGIAYFVVGSGFATIIIAAIKGVSNQKQK